MCPVPEIGISFVAIKMGRGQDTNAVGASFRASENSHRSPAENIYFEDSRQRERLPKN